MAAGQIHVNPETGEPGKCSARIKCPYGENAPHFEHERDARLYYEIAMEEGEESGRKVFAVVDAARTVNRLSQKLKRAEFMRESGAPGLDEEIAGYSRGIAEAESSLKENGLEARYVIDEKNRKLRPLKDIKTMVTTGKSLPELFLDKKAQSWDTRLEKRREDLEGGSKSKKFHAAINLKLSVIRELPTKRIFENKRIFQSLREYMEHNWDGSRDGVVLAIPGIGEAAENRKGSGVIGEEQTQEFVKASLDRAADYFEKIDRIVGQK